MVLLVLAALAAPAPAMVDGVPLATAQAIWQVELLRLPPEAMQDWVNDPSPAVRARAALALGRLRTEAAGAPLARLVKDPDPTVRRAAAFALGQTPGTERAVAAAWRTETDRATLARLAVALGKQGGPEAVDLLLDGLDGPAAAGAAEGLGRLAMRRVEGAATERVARRLLDQVGPLPVGDVRGRAAWALARMGLPTASEPTVTRLAAIAADDPQATVRAWALRALVGVTAPADLGPALTRAAADAAPGVRIGAARALGKGGVPGAGPLLARLLADPDPGVRVEAVTAVGAAMGDAAPAMLRDVLAGPDAGLRAAAVAALGAAGRLPGTPEDYLGAESPLAVRVAAVEAISDPARLVKLATTAAEAPLRSAAAGRLLGLEKPRAADVAALTAGPDAEIAQAAADWFREHPDVASEKALLDRLRRGDLGAAEAATFVRALAALYRTGRVGAPPPDAAAVLTPWLGLAEVREDAAVVAAVLRLPVPPGDHPTRRLPALEEVLRIRSARVFTAAGEIRIDLDPEAAPYTVWNFATLADRGYYDGVVFHRVVPDFVVQAGDPRGDGWGGPGWEIPDEINERPYEAGAVGMALSGPDTGGSQWFVTLSPQPHLDGGYTVFGHVTDGLRNAWAVQPGTRIERIVIERAP